MAKKSSLPKSLTTVTPFSKAVALSMFVLFPIIAFHIGRFYEKGTTPVGYCSPHAPIPYMHRTK